MTVLRNIHKSYFLIFFSVLVLYLFSLQNNFSSSHDAITYLRLVTEGKELFHPHHLIYNLVLNIWINTWHFILPNLEIHFLAESFQALCGSAIVLVCYIFFTRRFYLDYKKSAVYSSIIAFSYGVWAYSTNVEVYSPSILFCMLLLLRITRKELKPLDCWYIALLHIAAILFHQVNVLLTPVVVFAIYNSFETGKLKRSLQFLFATAIPVIVIYASIAWYIGKHDLPSVIRWILFYATELDYWKELSLQSIFYVATGLGHAFIGAHFIFRMPSLTGKFQESLSSHSLQDELFLVRNMNEQFASVLFALSIALAIIVLILVVRLMTFATRNRVSFLQKILFLTLISYSIFFIFWMPENLEFWIFQSILIWLLILGENRLNTPIWLAGILSALLFTINFFGSMDFLQEKENDFYYSRIHPLSKILVKGDLVITEAPWINQDYVGYFSDATTVDTTSDVFSMASSALEKGYKVVVMEAGDRPGTRVDSLYRLYPQRVNLANDSKPYIRIIQ
jgi:hypothetical protein